MISLKSINVRVWKGEFLAIIGEVGSGKSSLISSIIGDLIYLDKETININWEREVSANTKDVIEQLNHAIKLSNQTLAKNPPIKINGTVSLVE